MTLRASCEKWEQTIEEKDALLAEQEDEMATLREQCALGEAQVEEHIQNIEQLASENATLKIAVAEMDALRARAESAEDQAASSRSELSTMQPISEAFTKVKELLQAAGIECGTFESVAKSLETLIASSKSIGFGKGSALSRESHELDKKKAMQLEQRYALCQQELEKANAENSALSTELGTLRNHASEETESLRKQLQDASGNLKVQTGRLEPSDRRSGSTSSQS